MPIQSENQRGKAIKSTLTYHELCVGYRLFFIFVMGNEIENKWLVFVRLSN
ncbi:hypothetical protein RND71_031429 [Anisodus tanguticus]|uniref:Uncharacterized protein n=1 Tax=Anisodus tanguticus TaxID=243964 RepID=A0AAE1RAJ6_9SOLA|nr:hypothetical protein RND71_031429 [Anisodus tanguticus]